MFRRVVFLALILTVLADTQVTYSIGGSNVIFVFSRSGNITSTTWTDFAATADGSGALTSGSGAVPAGFLPGTSYAYPPEGLVRCTGAASGLAYFQVSSSAPAIRIFPANGNDTAWASNQAIVFRAGSVTYTNL